MRRHHRRNPELLGIDLEDGLAVAGGIWGTRNVAGFARSPLSALTAPLDSIRPGLGMAGLEFVSAWLVGKIVHMFRPRWGAMATLGGGALAVSDTANAAVGSVNLIEGQPVVYRVAAPQPKALPAGNGVVQGARLPVGTSGL